ncbi:MAG: histone deacetylase, partial [Desulfofustis sp.]|nr:histone deacetylase [Desulfofustis sp.]
GTGYTVNVPLPGGFGDREYAAIFNDIVIPVGRAYRPELILVSAGFDIYHGDPLGSMSVGPAGFAYMTRALLGLADEVCQGRLLVTLEGGYNLKGQRDGALAVLSELRGGPLTDDDSEFYLDDDLAEQFKNSHNSHDAIGRALEAAGNHWNI